MAISLTPPFLGAVGSSIPKTPPKSAVAAGPPKPKSTLLLDMPTLEQTAFTDQYATIQKRQKVETEKTLRDEMITQQGNREITDVNDRSRASADLIRQRQLDILGGIDQNIGKANEAMRLTDSGDPMDRLTLWYLQQTDPAYTRDGNLRRIEYLNTVAASVGAVGAIQQDAFVKESQAIMEKTELAKMEGNEDLLMLTLMEKQGAERIAAVEGMIASQTGMMQNTNIMRQSALASAPDEAVQAALDKATADGADSANIGGVEVPKSFLSERVAQIADRKYLMATRANDMATVELSNMDSTAINEAIEQASADETGLFVTEGGTSISLARLKERQAALTNTAYAQLSMSEGIKNIETGRRRESDERILATMNPVELNTILKAGGKWEGRNITFDTDQVETAYNRAKGAQTESDNMKILAMQGGFSAAKPMEFTNYLDSIHVPGGDAALQAAIDSSKSRTKIAAAMLEDPNLSDMGKLNIHAGLDADRENIDKAITATATKQAGGNKNLAMIIESHMRGQPVPQEIMEGIITNEAAKGNSLAPYLGEFNKQYLEAKSGLAAQYAEDPAFLRMSKAEQDDYITTQALDAVKNASVSSVTARLFAGQMQIEGNPLKGKMTPPAFLMLVDQAERDAATAYGRQMGWSEAETNAQVLSGQDSGLAYAQFARTLMALDEKQAGLGAAYMNWWNSEKAQNYVGNFIAVEGAAQPTPQALGMWSLTSPAIAGSMQTYGRGLIEGHRFIFQDQLAREHAQYANFGTDPIVKQAFLLEQTEGLSNSEKQIAISIIQPVVDEAKLQRDMSPMQMSQYVEGRLRQITPPSGDAQRIWKKVLDGRGKALGVVDSFINAQSVGTMFYAPVYGGSVSARVPSLGKDIDKEVGSLSWFTDLQKAK